MTRPHGIDVSSVQGQIDWPRVAEAGFRFAIVKATESVHTTDPWYGRHVAGARAAGLIVGAYHYFSPRLDRTIEAQTDRFWRVTGGLGARGRAGELPPVLDVEWGAPTKAGEVWRVAPALVAGRALTMARQVVDRWGRWPLIYSYPWYLQSLPASDELRELARCCPLWLASYPYGTTPPRSRQIPPDTFEPSVPAPWTAWTLCQYSGNGGAPVPGVLGDCDRNWARSVDVLRELAQLPAEEPLPAVLSLAHAHRLPAEAVEGAIEAYRDKRDRDE